MQDSAEVINIYSNFAALCEQVACKDDKFSFQLFN